MKPLAKKLKAIHDYFDNLKFKPHCTEPRHYGSVTIYTDTKRSQWRVKPFPGASQENRVAMKSTIADKPIQWATVVDHVKRLEQVWIRRVGAYSTIRVPTIRGE